MDVSGTLWLALPCSLYIWGLSDHNYAAKISWVQGQSHQKQYTDYLESKPVRLGSGTASSTAENYYIIKHTQIACCRPPAVTGRWKVARKKVEHTFLVQSSLQTVPTSSLCTPFLENIYVMSLCSRKEVRNPQCQSLSYWAKAKQGNCWLTGCFAHNYRLYPHLKSALCQCSQYP